MKLSLNTDFTQLPRAGAHVAAEVGNQAEVFDRLVLDHDERNLRRRVVTLSGGTKILVDLPQMVALGNGDLLVLDDGRAVRVEAAPEAVYAITARDQQHFGELCWHVGSRHAQLAIDQGRILVLRDAALRSVLEAYGAAIEEDTAPFQPLPGTSHSGHGGHGHAHGHGHGEIDAFGRKPGDPHYGHNHA